MLIFSGQKQMFGLFMPMTQKAAIFVVDTVRTNQMPNMTALYNAEHNSKYVLCICRMVWAVTLLKISSAHLRFSSPFKMF